MDYSTLTARINELAEYTFTAAQISLFVQQTEQLIFQTVEFPALRATDSGSTVASTRTVTLPSDFNWPYSLLVVNGANRQFLLNKDTNFLYEAYPDATSEGVPKHYALSSDTQLILGPIPDGVYSYELEYSRYPTSIVTAGTTWLGDFFDNALLNGAMLEAARFQKAEQDIVQLYSQMFEASIMVIKNSGDGKLRQDMYRSGQTKNPAR